ncbi:hypothetical protein J2X46_002736 [Nocardioides sp. BE266]|uniref:hypothetical protein n=1 Tax=Nocardioides sp. BE266 TaxID=2817725 RepID=UPI002856689D|nr:hypothetical protein [Nocardioides sp. BE266]MDR7253746.1 hypothetical protein [Nocardioides sp. BE266]
MTAATEARDAGMRLAEDGADPRLKIAVDKVIAEAIASGEPFSANSIRRLMPAVRSGLIGSRVHAAALRKEPRLVKVGEEASTLKSTHAKPVAIWAVAS